MNVRWRFCKDLERQRSNALNFRVFVNVIALALLF